MRLLLVLLLSAVPIFTFSQSTLKVSLAGVKVTEGTIYVALHASEESFPNDEPLKSLKVAADASEVYVVFEDLNAGEYALSVFHDVNDNTELDKNIMGIPKEPFGFSNDEMGMFGPPSFSKCIIHVPDSENVSTTVTLKEM